MTEERIIHRWTETTPAWPPTAIKTTTRWALGAFHQKVYEREIRRPYTSEELRHIRKLHGVGRPPWRTATGR